MQFDYSRNVSNKISLNNDAAIAVFDTFKSTAVNLEAVKTFYCPERYSTRFPQQFSGTISTAQATGTNQYPFVTDGGGNGAWYIFPSNLWNNGAGAANAYIVQMTGVAADGTVGTVGTVAGPLNPQVANMTGHRLNAATVSFIPVNSDLNNQGTLSIVPIVLSPGGNYPTPVVGGPGSMIPLTSLTNYPFYTTGSLKTSYRMVDMLFNTDNSLPTVAPTTGVSLPGYILYIIGGPANTTVGNILITYDDEFIPPPGVAPLSHMEKPPMGALTSEFISALIAIRPSMVQCSVEEAEKVFRCLEKARSVDYDVLLNALKDCA